jgi:hypothetical protein
MLTVTTPLIQWVNDRRPHDCSCCFLIDLYFLNALCGTSLSILYQLYVNFIAMRMANPLLLQTACCWSYSWRSCGVRWSFGRKWGGHRAARPPWHQSLAGAVRTVHIFLLLLHFKGLSFFIFLGFSLTSLLLSIHHLLQFPSLILQLFISVSFCRQPLHYFISFHFLPFLNLKSLFYYCSVFVFLLGSLFESLFSLSQFNLINLIWSVSAFSFFSLQYLNL